MKLSPSLPRLRQCLMVRAYIQKIQSLKVHVSLETKSLQSSGTPHRPGIGHAVHANRAPSVASPCGSSRLKVPSGAFQRKCLRWSVPKSSVSNASPWPAECGGLVEALCGDRAGPHSSVSHCHMQPGLGCPPESKALRAAGTGSMVFPQEEGKLLGAVLEIQNH